MRLWLPMLGLSLTLEADPHASRLCGDTNFHWSCYAKAPTAPQVLCVLYTEVACRLRETVTVAGVPLVDRLWLANPPVASRRTDSKAPVAADAQRSLAAA